MKLFYDKGIGIEQKDETTWIIYSPATHTWIKVNKYMYSFIDYIINHDGNLNIDEVINLFKEKYNIEITKEIIEEQINKLIESEIFFESKRDLETAHELTIGKITGWENSKIITAYLHPTLRCNFNCAYCYNENANVRPEEEISTEKWIEIIEKLKKLGVQKFMITGGEPLLRKDLTQIIKYCKNGQGKFYLLTNGSLLKDRFFELIDLIDGFSISLDSLDMDTNSINRSQTGFKDILEVFELFNKYAPDKLKIKTVVTKNNLAQIKDFKKEIKARYSFDLNLALFGPRNQDEISLVPDVSPDLMFDESLNSNLKMNLYRCGACYNIIAIDPRGDIYPCQCLLLDELKMANILDDNWYESFLNSKVRKKFGQLKVDEMKKCQDCSYRYFCGGGCPAISYKIYGDLNSHIEFLCDYSYELMRKKLVNADVKWKDV